MKGFIEIHTIDGKTHLVNIQHIVEVDGSVIYTDDIHPDSVDLPHFECTETYSKIRAMLAEATGTPL